MTSHQEATRGTGGVDETVTTLDIREYDSPTTGVAEAVSEATGREPTELPPLQGSVDADSLDRLFEGANGNWLQVSFTYAGVNVLVTDTSVEVWR